MYYKLNSNKTNFYKVRQCGILLTTFNNINKLSTFTHILNNVGTQEAVWASGSVGGRGIGFCGIGWKRIGIKKMI